MPLLNFLIPPRKHEQIRDVIGAYLFDEISNQYSLSANPVFNLQGVYIERHDPLNETELPFVSVNLTDVEILQETNVSSQRKSTYSINCVTGGEADDSNNADKKASYNAQRLSGLVDAILSNPLSFKLGMTENVIMHTEVTKIENGEIDRRDSGSIYMSSITFEVIHGQDEQFGDGTLLMSSFTNIKLSESDQGFIYEYSNT